MDIRGEGKAAIAGLAAVILIAGYFIFRQVSDSPGDWYEDRYETDWICEECSHRFTASPQRGRPRACPECPGEAVRNHIYYDKSTGELVELYRSKPNPDFVQDTDAWYEYRFVKKPGGEWQEIDPEFEMEHEIPIRVSRPGDLRPAPPPSRYRE